MDPAEPKPSPRRELTYRGCSVPSLFEALRTLAELAHPEHRAFFQRVENRLRENIHAAAEGPVSTLNDVPAPPRK